MDKILNQTGGESENKAASFSRRSFVIGALQAGALCILAGRLAWLQISQNERYKTLSDKNRINIKIIPPSRGQILDRFGDPLAVNNRNFRVLMTPEQVENIRDSLRSLQGLIDLQDEQIDEIVEKSKKSSKFVPLEVKENLTWEEVSKIEVNLPNLAGLSIDVGEIRTYPLSEAGAHTVGYVGLPERKDLNGDPVLRLPGFRIGKTGIEKALEADLRGQKGIAEVEVNVAGREVRELKRHKSASGQNIELTLDSRLQEFTHERLSKERSAAAVTMDAMTGEIYALCSFPSFDPNMFTHGLSATQWEKLLADPGYPLTNKAIAGQYPPASTFKMITALAGLRAGVISPHRHVHCSGFYTYGKDRFHCWKRAGHGALDIVQALSQSCDIYFYEVAVEIGIDKIAQTAREFGLGQKLDFELSQQRPGLVPDKDWKMGYHGKVWRPGETIVAGIGQGALQATPLQLAVMTARLINGGYAVHPTLTKSAHKTARSVQAWPKMDVQKAHIELIKKGMDMAVNHKKGTGFSSRIENPALSMGGKTGTAQVRKITMSQRRSGVKNEELPWKQRHHGLFVGYAPIHKPRYVTSVIVEHGVGGSVSAAPIARDLLYEAQKLNPAHSKT